MTLEQGSRVGPRTALANRFEIRKWSVTICTTFRHNVTPCYPADSKGLMDLRVSASAYRGT